MTELARYGRELDLNPVYNRTFSLAFTVAQSDDTPVDLTTYTAKMQIRASAGGTLYLELTDSSGITLGGALGTVSITITDEQTEAFTFTEAVYDLVLVSQSEVQLDVLYGAIYMHDAVTEL